MFKKHFKVAAILLALGLGNAAMATSTFVSYDSTTGAVTYDPSFLVGPLINICIAAIAASVGLYLVVRGARWVFRLIKG